MSFWGRIAAAVGVGAATTGLVLIETDVWHGSRRWTVLFAAVLGITAAFDFIREAIRARVEERVARLRRCARDGMRVLLPQLSGLTGISYERIGMHCLMLPRWYRLAFPRRVRHLIKQALPNAIVKRLPAPPALQSVERWRVASDPSPSGIAWTREKGIVGKCWRDKVIVGLDCREKYGSLLGCAQHQWEVEVPDGIRLGLTHAEFCRIGGKYNAVIVAPILLPNGEFIGCLTVDTPWNDGGEEAADYERLWSRHPREAIDETCRYISAWVAPST